MFGGIAVAGNLLCVSYTDARGKMFLVDLEDRRVVSRWGFEGPDGGYADAGGVAMDSAYNIFVADTANDMLRRFTAFGRELARIGNPTDRGAGSAVRDRAGTLDRPTAVAVHGQSAFVTCGERKLVRGVQRVDLKSGRILDRLRSLGDSEGRFGAPRGIAAHARGVFVADTLHGVIQRFRLDGSFVCEIPTAARHDEVSRPVSVVPLPKGELLVADQGDRNGLRRVGGDAAPATIEPGYDLDEPIDLAIDERDRIYVLDRHGERVVRLGKDLSLDRLIVDLAEVGFGD